MSATSPARASIKDACRRVEQYRGRPLHLVPVITHPSSPSGMWVATPAADYIFHISPTMTSALHAAHCVLHELGHIVLDHPGDPNLHQHVGAILSPLWNDPAASIMLRTAHQADPEHEAEVFATVACALLGDVRTATLTRGIEDVELYARLRLCLSETIAG